MSDESAIRLLNVIRRMSDKSNSPDTLTFGDVVSVDPLEIDIGNGITLTQEFLFLGQMCRPHKVTIPHTHQINVDTENAGATANATAVGTYKGDLTITTVGQATTTVIETSGHKHQIKEKLTEDVHKEGTDYEECVTIEIEPKLKEGDKVLMFAFNNYQMYYVAERIEE